MGLPQYYRGGASNVIATYDFFELSSNIGYKTFYGLKNNEGTTLVTERIESNDFKTDYAQNTGSEEYNFDYNFKRQMTIGSAPCYVALTYSVINTAAAVATQAYSKIRVLHVTGAAETVIGSEVTTDTIAKSSGSYSRRICVTFALTEKLFKINDILRIEIVIYRVDGSDPGQVRFYHDPANRGTVENEEFTGEAASSDIIVIVPFKVQT